jgi:hypothetical protein
MVIYNTILYNVPEIFHNVKKKWGYAEKLIFALVYWNISFSLLAYIICTKGFRYNTCRCAYGVSCSNL